MTVNKQLFGHMASLLTVCVWGFVYVPIVILLRSFSPVEILFYRFAFATAALYIIHPKPMAKVTRRQQWLFAGAGLMGVTSYFLFQDFALLHTTASNVGEVVALAPLFTALLSWWILGERRPPGAFFSGAFLALIGIGLISFAGSRLQLRPRGDVFALLAALSWAVYCVLMKKISAFDLPIIQVTRRIFSYGLLFLLPFMWATEFRLGLERFAQPQNIAILLFLGLGASALCFFLWNFAVNQLGPAKTSIYLYLIPLVAVAFSVGLLEEQLGILNGLGIALTLIGLLISKGPSSIERKCFTNPKK